MPRILGFTLECLHTPNLVGFPSANNEGGRDDGRTGRRLPRGARGEQRLPEPAQLLQGTSRLKFNGQRHKP